MKYLLDTNIVSFYIKGHPAVVKRLQKSRPSEIGMSAITLFELNYGTEKKGSAKLKEVVDAFIATIETLPFNHEAATQAGFLQAKLEKKGLKGSLPDILIAGQALASQLILVTNNTKDFTHIKGLKIEDWTI